VRSIGTTVSDMSFVYEERHSASRTWDSDQGRIVFTIFFGLSYFFVRMIQLPLPPQFRFHIPRHSIFEKNVHFFLSFSLLF
jgi:hypothetical protein